MKKVAISVLIVFCFAFVSGPPVLQGDGKFIKGHKIEEGYYVSIRECADSVPDPVKPAEKISLPQLYLMFSDGWDDKPVFEVFHLDTIRRRAFRSYCAARTTGPMIDVYTNQLPEVLFVNRKLGFLYGTSMAYRYYPFMYRTEDGGKTWALLTSSELGTMHSFSGEQFHMFGEKQGIIIWSVGRASEQTYSLTSDGGATWTVHAIKTAEDAYLTNTTYTMDGLTMTFAVNGKKENEPVRTIVMRSTDFGRTFKELK